MNDELATLWVEAAMT